MGEFFLTIIGLFTIAIEIFAVSIIIIGFILATWRYIRRFKTQTHEENFNFLKVELGSALLLALEILVFANVIETISVSPGFLPVVFLAIIILIRTVMNWTLTLQIEGHWPWQFSKEVVDNA